MINRLEYYVEGRLFEWIMAISMVWLGIEIYFYPNALKFSAFQQMNDLLSEMFVAAFMFLIGIGRVIALLLNGHWVHDKRVGPMGRAVMAVVSAWMWAQFAFALLKLSSAQGYPSPGLPFWVMFVLGELYVAYKAALNARRAH